MKKIDDIMTASQDIYGSMTEPISPSNGNLGDVEVYPEDISDLSEDLHRDFECFSDEDDKATVFAMQNS